MNEAVIVSTVRTPVGRGQKGTLTNTRADDLAALVLKESVSRAKIDPALVEDVFLGCAMPEGSQGLNFARLSSLLFKLLVHFFRDLLMKQKIGERRVGKEC